MNNALEELQHFIAKVNYMRGRQRTYFMQRNDTNLNMAKAAEKEVDNALAALSKKGYKPVAAPKPTQQSLL